MFGAKRIVIQINLIQQAHNENILVRKLSEKFACSFIFQDAIAIETGSLQILIFEEWQRREHTRRRIHSQGRLHDPLVRARRQRGEQNDGRIFQAKTWAETRIAFILVVFAGEARSQAKTRFTSVLTRSRWAGSRSM